MAVIVIVEDDVSILDAMALLFACQGWDTKGYATGEAFLDDYSREPGFHIDCLVLDAHLDGIGSADLVEKLADSHVPIVTLTARPKNKVAPPNMKPGISTILSKPIQAAELVETVSRVING